MSFPETDIFTRFVSRVFRIEDVTSEDPQKGFFLRYRGELLNEDSAQAYDQLAELLSQYNATCDRGNSALWRRAIHQFHIYSVLAVFLYRHLLNEICKSF